MHAQRLGCRVPPRIVGQRFAVAFRPTELAGFLSFLYAARDLFVECAHAISLICLTQANAPS